jgi:hypothetical protein
MINMINETGVIFTEELKKVEADFPDVSLSSRGYDWAYGETLLFLDAIPDATEKDLRRECRLSILKSILLDQQAKRTIIYGSEHSFGE